jgi:hypothetical protein
MRRILAVTLAAITAASSVAAAAGSAQAAPRAIAAFEGRSVALDTVQYRDDRRGDRRGNRGDRGNRGPNRDAFRDRSYWDRRNGRGYYDRNYRGVQRDEGAAVAAGFLGFVLGAAIAGSQTDRTYANQRMSDRNWINSCSQRYRSFDPNSGTYLGYDGYRHYCR